MCQALDQALLTLSLSLSLNLSPPFFPHEVGFMFAFTRAEAEVQCSEMSSLGL